MGEQSGGKTAHPMVQVSVAQLAAIIAEGNLVPPCLVEREQMLSEVEALRQLRCSVLHGCLLYGPSPYCRLRRLGIFYFANL
jgi:hypothetical protein